MKNNNKGGEKNCKHEGYWFSVPILFGLTKKYYLWCDNCKRPIEKAVIYETADMFHCEGNKFYTYYPSNK